MRWITALMVFLALTLAGILVAWPYLTPLGGSEVTTTPVVPDPLFVGHDGEQRRLSGWAGKTRLVLFGYTRSPHATPVTLRLLSASTDNLSVRQVQKLQVVFVSVDPATDTPSALGPYLKSFSPHFAGLTGNPDSLKSLAARLYVYVVRHPDGMVDYGETVAVVDRQGRLRRVYNKQALAAGELKRDLPKLLR